MASVQMVLLLEEHLYLVDELHAVLFHHYHVRSFAEFNPAFVGGVLSSAKYADVW